MDKAFKLFFCMLLCVSIPVALSGCSDSGSSSTGNNLEEGPTNDAGYSSARQTVEGQLDNLLLSMNRGFNIETSPGSLSKILADSFDFSYNSSSGWWSSYYTTDYTDYYYYYADSVRFSSDGTIQQEQDSNTDKLEYKFHTGLSSAEGSEYTYEFDFNCDFVYTRPVGTDTVTLNGTGGYDYQITYNGEDYSFTLDDTYSNIKVRIQEDEGDEYYPHAGTITETLSGYVNTSSGYESATFTIRITFYEDYYEAYVSDGTYYWEWEEDYPSSISGYWAPPHP
ncbi:MAG: hypothetical protein GF307_03665 [candidate division Zixibacteria bacterium]|nr:hypothetical protein [candidate division Zixibacteria bacterium]